MSLFKDKLELGIEEAEFEASKQLSELPSFFRWLFIVSLIGIIPAYFVAKAASKSYWLEKYSSLLVSAKPSFSAPSAPKIVSVTLTTAGPGTYSAVATIANENVDLSLNNVPYKIDFYNSSKEDVYTAQGTFFLLPNQTKYIVVPKIVSNDAITSTNVGLPDTLPWQKKLSLPTVNLVTSQPTISDLVNPVALSVQGDVLNSSPYTIGKIHLTFILKDADNKVIGSSVRDEFTVSPYERRSYRQLWPNINGINVSSVQVIAETNTLDPKNLTVSTQQGTSASDLGRPKSNNQ